VAASPDPIALARTALNDDNAAEMGRLLQQHAQLRAVINEPISHFDSPAILQARSRAMIDVLLAAGADINGRSRWWAGGFGLLDSASPGLSAYAVERGATMTPHAAARLGLLDQLETLVAADPALVHARGGDGQTPLHFASTVAVADYLLDHGADINARDIDHESTPAQYMIDSRQDIVRRLVERGCVTDILMAAALGDLALIRRHLDADAESIRVRVSSEYFPMVGDGRSGGTIYQWKLGWYVSAVQVAMRFKDPDVAALLIESSPAEEQLLNACWLGDEAAVRALLAPRPDLASSLTPAGRRHLAHAARDDNRPAVRLMILAGLPADAKSQHGATALHWAAWFGHPEEVRLILDYVGDSVGDGGRQALLDRTDNDFNSTPLGWANHGAESCWHREKGDYPATIEILTKAKA
jgi:ankyrin repeat protein